MSHKDGTSYPIARCPKCGCTVMYANNPKEKNNIVVKIAPPDYQGPMHKCARCNAMFAVITKVPIADKFISVPIMGSIS